MATVFKTKDGLDITEDTLVLAWLVIRKLEGYEDMTQRQVLNMVYEVLDEYTPIEL